MVPHTRASLALRNQRVKGCKFKTNLGYMVRPCFKKQGGSGTVAETHLDVECLPVIERSVLNPHHWENK